jgi:tetratricopeptide (TPR) repeat protein
MGSIDSLSAEEQTHAIAIAGAVYLAAQPPMVDKALAMYQKLLVRDPEDMQALNNVACMYIDNVNPPEPAKALEYSQRAYDAMRRRGVTQPMLMDTHGWVLANNKRVEEGIVLLQEVVQRQPFPEARFHLAQAFSLGNYPDPALRQATEAKAMIAAMEAKGSVVDPITKAKVDQLLAKLQPATAPAEPAAKP